jgi:RHS repeat-associated protein
LTFGSGDSDSFTYDPNTGRQTQYAFQVNGSTESGTLTLGQLAIYDPFSSANTQTCTNSYDDLARLLSNNCGSAWSQTFGYDVFGNMTQSGSGSFLPTYNAATNQYATLPGGTPSYSSTGAIINDGLHSYYWDSENKNVKLDSSVFMTYDAFGRWVELGTPAGYSQALYAPDGSEFAVMSGSSVVHAYVHLPQGAVATYAGNSLWTYWHPDWLGTPRLYSSPSQTVNADTAFSAYGEQYQGPSIDTFFTGAAQLPEANDLRTFPARNLSVVEGRWQSPDPAGLGAVDLTNPQTLNRYAYVVGNPLGLVDPTGMYLLAPGRGGDYDPCAIINCFAFVQTPVRGAIGGGGGDKQNPPPGPTVKLGPPAKTGTKPCASGGNAGRNGGAIWTVTYTFPLTAVGAFIGSFAGPEGTLPGALISSMFGVGPTASFVPSTHSVYVGVTLVGGLGISGGGGGSINVVNVPRGQNPNSIANGESYSITYQPTPFTGATATKSPGSGPPVVGPSFGTRIPVAASASYNICLWNCGCGG